MRILGQQEERSTDPTVRLDVAVMKFAATVATMAEAFDELSDAA